MFFLVGTKFTNFFQIVHWRNHLRFPEDTQLTLEAKDLVYRLLCDVDHRLGTRGAQEIKVRCSFSFNYYNIAAMLCQPLFFFPVILNINVYTRLILGSMVWSGINCMKWRQHLNLKLTGSWIPKTS